MRSDARRWFTRLLEVAFLLFFVSGTLAQSPAGVQRGLAWLQAQVQPDGSVAGEASSIATSEQAGAEVLSTLSLLGSPPASLLATIRAQAPAAVEHMSRRVLALKSSGDVVAISAGELLAVRQPGSGWGFDDEFAANSIDTAFALSALQAGGLGSGTAVSEALGFLVSERNQDGGWGINGQSSIYATSLVLAALEAYSTAFVLEGAISSARDWLLSRRTNGAYAGIFDGASAFLGLSTSVADPSVLQPLVDAIAAAQAVNGSWSDDPFVSALALRALAGWTGSFGGLRGRVLDAASGAPIAGAQVTLVAFDTFSTVTDANGAFSFVNIRPGTHAFSISAAGYGVLAGQVSVRSGETADLGDIKLRRDGVLGATIRGKVRDGSTQSPIAGVNIAVTVGTTGLQTTSNDTGDYLVTDVPAGTATVAASRNDYRTTSGTIAVVAGGVYDLSIIMLPAQTLGAAVLGTVTNSLDGSPVAGATVVAASLSSSAPSRSTTTDASGKYSFTDLFTGSVRITVSASGYVTQAVTFNLPAATVLQQPVSLAPANPQPGPGMEVAGRVVDSRTLLPLAGATVAAVYGTQSHATASGSDGVFRLPGYSAGEIRLTISKETFETSTFTINPGGIGLPNLGDFPLVPERAGASLANLSIANIDRTGSQQSVSLDLSGDLLVTVRNAGPNPTPRVFSLLAFLDRNGDGTYTPGTDVALGESGTVAPLQAEEQVTVAISLSGQLPFLDAPIHVWVDSRQEVVEGDEENNTRSTADFCRQCMSSTTQPPLSSPSSLQFGSAFSAFYKAYLLGPIPGVPLRYGFALPKRGDSCTIYFGGLANGSSGQMYAVRVIRDQDSRIVGFDPSGTQLVASAPYNDGGATYFGPDNHILLSRWPDNKLGIYRPGETAPGKIINLATAPYSVAHSHAAINVVPDGYPGAGKVKLVSWSGGQWYSGSMRPDGNGYLEFETLQRVRQGTADLSIPGGPEGFLYAPKGSPAFGRDALIVSEYSAGVLSTYDLDANGDPIASSRRVFLSGVIGAEGAAIDPLTGDYVFTTFGGLNQSVIVRGFNKVQGPSDLTASRASVQLDASGRVVSLAARVGNAGPEPNAASKLTFYALRNGAAAEKLGEVPVGALGSGQYTDFSLALAQPTTLPGAIVVIDADRSVAECNEDNNAAPVAIEPLLGVITVRTAEPGYAPGSRADITATVMNPGLSTKSYEVEITITDAGGVPAASLGRAPVSALAGGATAVLEKPWIVPPLIAGTYRANAALFNADGVAIGQHSASFNVLAASATGTAMTNAVVLDKAYYSAYETVQITGRVRNEQSNAFLDNVTIRERILDGAGAELFRAERVVAQVPPSSPVEIGFAAPLQSAAPGEYVVQQDVIGAAGGILGSATARFTVKSTAETGAGIVATFDAAESVNGGDPFAIRATTRNQGNVALDGIPLTLRVADPVSGSAVATWTYAASIAQGGSYTIDEAWQTASLPSGTYIVALSATVGSIEIGLAQHVVRLGALVPFSFTAQVDVPPATVRVSNEVTISGIVPPARLRIEGGEFSVNAAAYSAVERTVVAGDRITVRLTSASGNGEKAIARLFVGAFSAAFEVTTLANDTTPDAFSFTSQSGAPLLATVTSNSVAITGINVPVPISIAGGEYSIGGGPYTSSPGTVSNGQAVTVRVTTPGAFGATSAATLTVSGVAAVFSVTTKSAADVAIEAVLPRQARVLALVSCPGSDTAACREDRRVFLANYLAAHGYDNLVVGDADAFRAALRGGRFNTVWISGGFEKLLGTLAAEIREAVFRGDALVLDGVHDSRNHALHGVAGVKVNGTLPQAVTVSLGAPFLPSGSFAIPGDGLRVTPEGATVAAAFGPSGDPAIMLEDYGRGKAILFAFDLVATLQGQATSALLGGMVDQSLDHVSPSSPARFTGGAWAAIAMEVSNPEPVAVDLEISTTLPEGFSLAASTPAPVTMGNATVWALAVPAASAGGVDFAVRVAQTAGSYLVPITLAQKVGTQTLPLRSLAVPVEVRGIAILIPQVVTELTALALPGNQDPKARDRAVAALQAAQTSLGQGGFEAAIGKLVEAGEEVASIGGADVSPQRASIAFALQEAARQWWSQLPACPAAPACRGN